MNKVTMMFYVSAALAIPALPSLYNPRFKQQQSFTPPHMKNGRGKFKRAGR